MSEKEYIDYIMQYVKCCKLRGNTYIGIYAGILVILDSMMSSVYMIHLEYPSPFPITNTSSAIQEGIYFDAHIANIMNSAISKVIHTKNNMSPITKKYPDIIIPQRSTDNAKHQLYYFDNNPSRELVMYEFYNMLPLNKADTYIVEAADNAMFSKTITVRFTVFKKKPKCEIQIYRNILDLL